ncbi:MAG: hypothetical protein AAGD10_17900 [Myxococcota bacterium]
MRAVAPATEPDSPVDAALRAIDEKLTQCSSAGRPFSLLVARGQVEALTETASVHEVEDQTVVTLPGINLDRACALAERWVRHHPGVRVGVASTHGHWAAARALWDRAKVALETAESGPVGPVVSMSWADVSTDLPSSLSSR